MITDSEIAQLLLKLYAGPEGFDYYEPGLSGICYGVKLFPDENVVCLRGSVNLIDWARDLFAIPTVFPHETFGPIHAGFAIGMERVVARVETQIDYYRTDKPTTVCGHSLGAARARILTALLLEHNPRPGNVYVLKTVVFGEPLSGMQPLADFLAPVESRSYRNGVGMFHDRVTDVPVRIPPDLAWVRASKLSLVSKAPSVPVVEEALDPFAFHHMPLYAAALAEV